MHFFEIGVSVEGSVATEEEVCYDADGPNVSIEQKIKALVFSARKGEGGKDCVELRLESGKALHWFAVAGLVEDFRGHVARSTACCSENVKCFFVHYP